MASFVTEVLASSGKLEKEDLASKISRMSRKVEDTKEEVCDMINKKYSEFLPKLQASEDLMQQVDMVSKEMETLKNCIEFEVQQNIHVAVNEYIKLKQQLEKNTVIIKMLEHLKEFHSAMEDFNKTLQEKKYVDAATHLEKARKNVDSLKDWKTSQVPLLSSLSSELTVQRENLIYHLGDEWKRLVIWRVPSTKESAGPKTFHKVELVLSEACSKDVEQKPTPLLCSVLQALAIQGDLQNKIKLFSQVLLKNMLKPLVMYASLELIVSEQHGEGTILGLECLEEENKKRSTPSQVYKTLLLLLKTLHTHLLDVSIGDRNLSAMLGELIWEEMSKCIIHDCLVYSIPTNSGELERYNIVIKETEAFEEALKNMEYLQVDSTDLLKYARDVNCHFASKKCRDVIVAARKLMTSKMHNTVKVCIHQQSSSGLHRETEGYNV
ncbi:centromere/kinetochore protein zw10 homolog [Poecilia latipinna]|uniref:centromere/kinetochore protein zw10 homolog n=1 Tax=Poecilia latipinna TaxID=48699 RepID=UPI00072EB8A5|nr:PREDICTED: centromere/kinetochore protein zw10 homolog [Poecilia latipinna]